MSIGLITSTSYKVLAGGVKIPLVGLGVYQARDDECRAAVKTAIEVGYRHFDSALAYRNEKLVGEAMLASGIPRSQLFFTTKLPPKIRGYEATVNAIEESLANCGLGYIDLYLIHAPYGNRESRLGQWKAIEEAMQAKKIRAGGVSNYNIHHIQELLDSSPTIKPVINQIELHPWLCREELVQYCRANEICLEAYSPLTRGQKLDDQGLKKFADKYDKSAAQILIRWSLQKGMNGSWERKNELTHQVLSRFRKVSPRTGSRITSMSSILKSPQKIWTNYLPLTATLLPVGTLRRSPYDNESHLP